MLLVLTRTPGPRTEMPLHINSHPWSIPLSSSHSTSINQSGNSMDFISETTCGFHFFLSILIPSYYDPLPQLQGMMPWSLLPLLTCSAYNPKNTVLKRQMGTCLSSLLLRKKEKKKDFEQQNKPKNTKDFDFHCNEISRVYNECWNVDKTL